LSLQTHNSSECHIFYLKTASNTESLTQLQLQTQASSRTHFTYQIYLNCKENSTDCTE